MMRLVTSALVLVVLASTASAADKPLGTWTRTAGDAKITFEIKADSLKVMVENGSNKVEADCDYGYTKDGYLFGRVNKVTTGGGGPSEGDLFSFKLKVEKDKMTLSELKASNPSDEGRKAIEGEYEKK